METFSHMPKFSDVVRSPNDNRTHNHVEKTAVAFHSSSIAKKFIASYTGQYIPLTETTPSSHILLPITDSELCLH